jgi:hypothetical protein
VGHVSEVDWDALVEDYKTGMPRDQLVAKYGITQQALGKGLRKRGLIRNTNTVAAARASIKADEQTLVALMAPASLERVEAMAEVGAAVIVSHRGLIGSTRRLVEKALSKIHHTIDNPQEIEESIVAYYLALAAQDVSRADVYKRRMNDALAAIDIIPVSKAIQSLVASLEKLVTMERISYKLDDKSDGTTYDDAVKEADEYIKAHRKQHQLTHQRAA